MKLPQQYIVYAQKNKWTIMAVIAAIAVLIYIYVRGRKDGRKYIPDAPYIENQEMWQATFNPNILAEELHRVMDSNFTLTGTKDAAWKKLLNLGTDNMIIAVYNTFNKRYASESKGSLTQWIDDEVYYDYLSGVKKKTLDKLRSLNCK